MFIVRLIADFEYESQYYIGGAKNTEIVDKRNATRFRNENECSDAVVLFIKENNIRQNIPNRSHDYDYIVGYEPIEVED